MRGRWVKQSILTGVEMEEVGDDPSCLVNVNANRDKMLAKMLIKDGTVEKTSTLQESQRR